MKIKITELEHIVLQKLLLEYSQEEAHRIKDIVMFGELSGKPSHGLLRLLRENYGAFTNTIKGKPEVIKKTHVSSLINGSGNVGMLIGSLAMDEVITIAKEHGIGIVGTRNSFNSTGSLSYYCEKIANENLIALVFCHGVEVLAPFSSKKALFGTNPIGFGIPSEPHPIIFDMSTSAITFGAIMKHKAESKNLPKNVAIDKEGNPTIDPEKASEGATLAFDNSYKGSGLAMMVEILSAVWTGASFATTNKEDGWGNIYMALSPDLLSNVESLKERSKELVTVLKNVETRDGRPIRIPGENTQQIRAENLKKGEIEVDDILLQKIKS
ncbi:MAG: Ldh family oxidoreductase [Candidatus Levyibacteriota bacterium]